MLSIVLMPCESGAGVGLEVWVGHVAVLTHIESLVLLLCGHSHSKDGLDDQPEDQGEAKDTPPTRSTPFTCCMNWAPGVSPVSRAATAFAMSVL